MRWQLKVVAFYRVLSMMPNRPVRDQCDQWNTRWKWNNSFRSNRANQEEWLLQFFIFLLRIPYISEEQWTGTANFSRNMELSGPLSEVMRIFRAGRNRNRPFHLTMPANSPGFPGSLQVFYEISRSLGKSTKSPGNYIPWLFSHFLFINFVGNVLLLHWKKWHPKKRSTSKNSSHFENFWGCLQICVLWGLAGMIWLPTKISGMFGIMENSQR